VILLALALVLAAFPILFVYEWAGQIWVCRRDGPRAGFCYAEPTVRARLGLDHEWDDENPRIGTIQIVEIVDLGGASPAGEGWVRVRSSDACWKRWPPGFSWCHGSGFGTWRLRAGNNALFASVDERDFVDRFNAFLRDPRQRSFVHRMRGDYQSWHVGFVLAAMVLVTIAVRRTLRERTRRWIRLAEEPTIVSTPYRGTWLR
jgi:hypothetical protein